MLKFRLGITDLKTRPRNAIISSTTHGQELRFFRFNTSSGLEFLQLDKGVAKK